ITLIKHYIHLKNDYRMSHSCSMNRSFENFLFVLNYAKEKCKIKIAGCKWHRSKITLIIER
ncbi:MAG: hypothetical protein WB511_05390, partial [Nitrososphaeraceae archaeon]